MAKIKHIALATQNVEKTANFYKEVFDLEEVGNVNNENAEGRYLSDGNINLAILHFKNEVIAGQEFGTGYSGIHHIGFQQLPRVSRIRLSHATRLSIYFHPMNPKRCFSICINIETSLISFPRNQRTSDKFIINKNSQLKGLLD